MDYEEAISYLEGLKIFGVRLGLTRITELLIRLDVPQKKYRTIHVTGTNGKGSVSSMLAGILSHAGIHTGLYSSPHLVSYTERIQVDGKPIEEKEFAAGIAVIKRHAECMVLDGFECPTQFEVLTALAFYCFAHCHVEYAVIEVGLGGTLDSTNVITPTISVITNVTFEHADRLGGTIESIAENKAGIIKEGVPVITAAEGVPLQVIRRAARDRHAKLFIYGEDFRTKLTSYGPYGQILSFSAPSFGQADFSYRLQLLGIHQAKNSAVAIMTILLLSERRVPVSVESMQEAFPHVRWPARFEHIPLGDQEIIVDGAHNPAGTDALRMSLDMIFPTMPRIFLLGILRDKDIDSMLDRLLRKEDEVVVTMPNSERADTAEDLARRVRKRCTCIEVEKEEEKALSLALAHARGKLLVMAGSLYLVGGLRQRLLERRQ